MLTHKMFALRQERINMPSESSSADLLISSDNSIDDGFRAQAIDSSH